MDDHIASCFICSWLCCHFTFTVFENYYVEMSKTRLTKVATSVSELIEEGADEKTIENIAYKFTDPLSRIIVVKDDNEVSASPKQEGLVNLTIADLKNDKDLAAVFTDKKENIEKIKKCRMGRQRKIPKMIL